MKTKIESKYMMATKAIHLTGDISRDTADICVVFEEDDQNFYGNWVFGAGFVNVAFPKQTTHDLTAEEVEHYHGRPLMIGGGFIGSINITGEDFYKHVVATKEEDGRVHTGTLVAPIKVGHGIVMVLDDERTWQTSTIQEIIRFGKEIRVKTQNSKYLVEYK
jgi:hypothetical protein